MSVWGLKSLLCSDLGQARPGLPVGISVELCLEKEPAGPQARAQQVEPPLPVT